jgi:predicted transcriptional regulator
MPIREIARRTGLSRNTIRKYLRSGAVEAFLRSRLAAATVVGNFERRWR